MRRVAWSVLTGLGVFFIVLAVLARFFLPGQVVKFPLSEYNTTTLIANGASYFSPKFVQEMSGVTLQATNTVRGDVAAAKATGDSGNVAVWQSYTAIEDLTNHDPVSIPAAPDTLAFNRRTGVLVSWGGNTLDGKRVTSVSGQGTFFPFGAHKQSYAVYDSTLGKPVLFRYQGTSSTDGVPTYIFVADVPAQQIGTQQLPGSLVGMSASEVTLPEFYSAHKTEYVDPETGVPLLVDQNISETLQDASGTTRLVLVSAELKTTPASVAKGVKTDKAARTEILLLTVIVPIAGGLLGLILLIIGLLLSRSGPEEEEYEDDAEPVGVAA